MKIGKGYFNCYKIDRINISELDLVFTVRYLNGYFIFLINLRDYKNFKIDFFIRIKNYLQNNLWVVYFFHSKNF